MVAPIDPSEPCSNHLASGRARFGATIDRVALTVFQRVTGVMACAANWILPPVAFAQAWDTHPRRNTKYRTIMGAWATALGDAEPCEDVRLARAVHLIVHGQPYVSSHWRYLEAIRLIRTSVESEEKGRISASIYSIRGVQTYINNLLFDYLKACEVEGSPEEQPVDWMHECLESLQHLPSRLRSSRLLDGVHKASQAINAHLDPIRQGNVPHLSMEFELEGRPVRGLRFPSPTVEGLATGDRSEVLLGSEFTAFLGHLRRTGQRHLYVNLQHRGSKAESISERHRCELLEGLEDDFSDVITVVTLPKNSHFYRQVGRYRYRCDVKEFKERMLSRMFDEDKGFYFPPSLNGLREEVSLLMDAVHDHYYHRVKRLDSSARRDFIEIMYLHLELHLLARLEVDSFNLSCKSSMDRGASANALLYAQISLRQGRDFDEELSREILGYLAGPALFVRNRAIMMKHAKRSLGALKRLYECWELSCTSSI